MVLKPVHDSPSPHPRPHGALASPSAPSLHSNAVPSNKALQLNLTREFHVSTFYSDACHPLLHLSAPRELGRYKVGPFTVPPGKEKAQVKVMVKLTLHGTVVVESAQQVVEQEYTEKVPVTPAEQPHAAEAAP